MKAVFFTEAGLLFGYGHLMRCLALAQGFEEKGIESFFYIRGEGNFSDVLKKFKFQNIDWLQTEIPVAADTIAVSDSYYFDPEHCNRLLESSKKAVFFDDNNRVNYPGGFIVNGILNAESLYQDKTKEAEYLLGPEYQVLRKAFWDAKPVSIKPEIQNILITTGGTDNLNLCPMLLVELNNLFPESIKTVIIGKGFVNSDEIKAAADKNTKYVKNADEKVMYNIMSNTDLAVSAAGQTLFELARLGVPTAAVQTADNQENNMLGWEKSGFIERLALQNGKISLSALKKFEDPVLRLQRSEAGRKIIDGQGVRRICSWILK
jgi:spore coat polysaccharide biosynthesis predicted glycosyltransferase SpsG